VRKVVRLGFRLGLFFSQANELYESQRKNVIKKIFTPEKSSGKAIVEVGEFITTLIQRRIRDLKTPEKAKSTLRSKPGKTNPLIDTEVMRRSVTFKVVK